MNQHTEEELKHLQLPDPLVVTVTCYLADGSEMLEEDYLKLENANKNDKILCAKHLFNHDTEIDTFFILSDGHSFYNPRIVNNRAFHHGRWRFRKVALTVFKSYIRFLNSKHQAFLYQAERNM
jgi:hypothetical protein